MTIRIYFLAKYIVIISTQVQTFLFHMRYLGIQQLEVRRRNFARKTLQREEEVGCAACAAVPKLFPQTSALMSYEISLLCFNPSLGDPYHRRPESDVFFYDGSWLFLCICDLWTWKWLALKRLDWRVVLFKTTLHGGSCHEHPANKRVKLANLTVISWIGYSPTRIWIDIHYH